MYKENKEKLAKKKDCNICGRNTSSSTRSQVVGFPLIFPND